MMKNVFYSSSARDTLKVSWQQSIYLICDIFGDKLKCKEWE